MTFDDPQLQQHYEQVLAIMTALPEDVRPICSLMDAYYWFNLVERKDSPKARDILKRLISPELRPALRHWYLFSNGNMNPAAMEFHQFLEETI